MGLNVTRRFLPSDAAGVARHGTARHGQPLQGKAPYERIDRDVARRYELISRIGRGLEAQPVTWGDPQPTPWVDVDPEQLD